MLKVLHETIDANKEPLFFKPCTKKKRKKERKKERRKKEFTVCNFKVNAMMLLEKTD